MTEEETAAQAELTELTQELSGLQHWLREIVANLPAAPGETGNADVDLDQEPDVATEVRSTVQCVLADHLMPALRDLDDAARYRPVRRRSLGKRTEP